MDQKQKNDSTTVSPFLSIAAALSCGGAFLVGLIWLVLMFFYSHELEEGSYRKLGLIMISTAGCAFVEVPLLTVWGVCADRKNKIALNIDNPKKDSGFLILAGGLSLACLIVIVFFSFEALLPCFGVKWSPALKTIESIMAPFLFLTTLIAPIAVPALFIRNIYAHLKWMKRFKQEVRDINDLPREMM